MVYKVWSQENLYLAEPDGLLFVPWVFVFLCPLCSRRVYLRKRSHYWRFGLNRTKQLFRARFGSKTGCAPALSLPVFTGVCTHTHSTQRAHTHTHTHTHSMQALLSSVLEKVPGCSGGGVGQGHETRQKYLGKTKGSLVSPVFPCSFPQCH